MSPLSYFLVALAVTSVMLSAIFLIAWTTQGRRQHTLTFSIAFLVAALLWIANLAQGRFPGPATHWLLVNALAMIALTLALLGHCQRVNCRWRESPLRHWIPPLLCYSAILWFTAVQPHAGLRTSLAPAYAACTLILSAALVLRFRDSPRAAEWGAAAVMVLFAACQLLAASVALTQGAEPNPGRAELYETINLLTFPAAFTGMGMFVVFLLASDLWEQTKETAVRDGLTGLLNRRGFAEAAEKAFATARRTDRPLAVIMTDIDRYQAINDLYGRGTGDCALRHYAGILSRSRRDEDILARVGGDRFALLLPGTEAEEGVRVAERLCREFERTPMDTDIDPLAMTASFGVATIAGHDADVSDIVLRADAALYRSKRAGRSLAGLGSPRAMPVPAVKPRPLRKL